MEERNEKTWTTDHWGVMVAAAGTVVAAIGVIFAARSVTYAARTFQLMAEQARMSVQPSLTFHLNFDPSVEKPIGYFVSNTGLGPAQIQRFAYFIDGKLTEPKLGDMDQIYDELEISKKYVQATFAMSWLGQGDGSFMPVGAVGSLLTLVDTVGAGFSKEEFQKKLQRLRVEVCYCSLYKECWEITSRPGLGTATKQTMPSCGES